MKACSATNVPSSKHSSTRATLSVDSEQLISCHTSMTIRGDEYLAKDGETLIVLFGGGTKRGQQRDIDRAKALFAEYKARKKALIRKAGVGQKKR